MHVHVHVHMYTYMLGLLSESDDCRVQKVLSDKVVKVDASLELCVVDLARSTGCVEGVVLTVPHLRLLLERVQEETHLGWEEKKVRRINNEYQKGLPMKFGNIYVKVYLRLPIPNLHVRVSYPIACSGKTNQRTEPVRCLALRTSRG